MKSISMRRIFSIVLALALVCQFAIIGQAEISLTITDAVTNVVNGDIVVSGTIAGAEMPTHVMGYAVAGEVRAADVTASNIAALGYSATTEANPTAFSITLKLKESAGTGRYTIIVGVTNAAEKYITTVEYVSVAEMGAVIDMLNNEETTAEDIEAAMEGKEDGLDYVGVSSECYKMLSDDEKLAMYNLMVSRIDGKYEGTIDSSNFSTLFNEAMVITAVNQGSVANETVGKIIYKQGSFLGFDMAEGFLANITDYKAFGEIVKAQDALGTIEEITAAVEVAGCIEALNECYYTEIVNFISANNDIFQVPEEDIENLNLRKNQKLLTAFTKRMKNSAPYKTVEKIQDKWDDNYRLAKKDVEGGGDLGGSTSSKDSVGTDKEYFEFSNNTVQDTLKQNRTIADYYDDVAGYEWAHNHILKLSEAGIINGVGNKKFDPSGLLTREQFVKILALAFDVYDPNAVSTFADVDPSAWYATYVASAQKSGITQGRGDNTFGVGAYMTREEMVTLAYRAASMAGINFKALGGNLLNNTFADKANIAEYATEAVDALYATNIVTGTPENEFLPKSFTTRAEAAVIISKLYTLKN